MKEERGKEQILRRTPINNLYWYQGSLYTLNIIRGKTLHSEKIIKLFGREYRYWNPYRSKLAALLIKENIPIIIGVNWKILYLGAGNGTTASYISDIVAKGLIYCVEKSRKAYSDLLSVAKKRKNIVPILADARKPKDYMHIGKVDMLYQDIAQRDQVDIFIRNMGFLRKEGMGILMVKARSIDVAEKPSKIYKNVKRALSAQGLNVVRVVDLSPYQKDHAAVVMHK
ncbi:MAG: fibrillarin-like rRNA/tRNA 2'-O-methyltransferase [Thermoplasmata archaeon]|nr:MAG: fibrillarin-like rRNA/tRNA 2'-O-methyltransferase [Thermoplasmata archaeon]